LNGRPCQEAAIGHFLVFQAAGIGLPKQWTGVFFRRSGTVFRAQIYRFSGAGPPCQTFVKNGFQTPFEGLNFLT
jgi:hypothetical protein